MAEPATTDPYDLLGVPPLFDIDPGQVERRWLTLSASLHPDRAADPVMAAKALGDVNRARSVLLDPESRANALLMRLGGPAKDIDRTLPDGFLMDIMEVREQAEEAVRSGDAAARQAVEQWAAAQRESYAARVGGMFAALGPTPTASDLAAIRVELNAWRYIERMIEQLG